MTYDELRDEFFRRIESLEISGTAELNRKCSEILGEILSENAPKISNIAQSCEKILHEYYEYMNETNVRIQKELDEKNGLRIAVRKADFPEKRVAQIAKSLADPTVPPETIQRRAGSAVENAARSFYDNFVRENAKFRSKAGIKCYIVRETDGNCCKWCSALAGRYVCGDEPNDVYRRHDNCTCTVTFENGRERQDKNKWQVTETLKVPYKPLVLDKNQAETLQKSQLAEYKIFEKGLTFGSGSGKIKSKKNTIELRKIKGEHSREYDLMKTNPKYDENDIKYSLNCQKCVCTYEARRRGFDVTAKPVANENENISTLDSKKGFPSVFKGAEIINISGITGEKVCKNIEHQMQEWGNGSRAIVAVHWKNNGKGHVFMAEQINGKTEFVDPQSNESDVKYYFKGIKTSMLKNDYTLILRTDNLEFTENIKKCCEEVDRK